MENASPLIMYAEAIGLLRRMRIKNFIRRVFPGASTILINIVFLFN